MERKQNTFLIIIVAVLCIIFSTNIYSSIKSFKYRRLCDQYREQLDRATTENRELRKTIEECQSITGSIGELCNRNISTSRQIIELVEQIRTQVYELESSLGCFSQLEYYQHWDSYYHNEGLME